MLGLGSFAAGLMLVFALAGCGGEGGSSGGATGGGDGDPPRATTPVDLPPGQRIAQLAWAPSRGNVTGYMVMVSRNQGRFELFDQVPSTSVAIPGQPGDVIRLIVVAVSDTGAVSEASPLSVPIRFHADPNAPTDPTPPVDPEPPAVGGGLSPTEPPASPIAVDAPPSEDPIEDPSEEPAEDDPAEEPPPPPTPTHEIASALRSRLLLADPRAPFAPLSAEAAAWLAPWLDAAGATDLTLVATAARPSHDFRDLVFANDVGQVLVAEGPALATGASLESERTPIFTLLPGERLAAVVDLDSDAGRDWLVVDAAAPDSPNGVDLETGERSALRPAALPSTTRWLGTTDLDGDGGAELLWQAENGQLELSRARATGPALAPGAFGPPGTTLLAAADLTGDGRDDLIARRSDGALVLGLTRVDAASGDLVLAWEEVAAGIDAAAELIATLDLDADGRAELVWRTGDQVEIRAIGESEPRSL